MRFEDLEEWRAYCRRASTAGGKRDRAVLRSDWAAAGITPPPALEDPAARTPLERAEALARRAEEAADPARRIAAIRQAIEWLDHPHPRTSAALRAAMRSLRKELEATLPDST